VGDNWIIICNYLKLFLSLSLPKLFMEKIWYLDDCGDEERKFRCTVVRDKLDYFFFFFFEERKFRCTVVRDKLDFFFLFLCG
jgi:hypothetical protein